MTKTSNAIAVAVAALAVVALLLVFGMSRAPLANAAVNPGDYGTTTDSTFASGTATRQLMTKAATLGSIVIGSSSPSTTFSQITVYDATSTMATSTAKVLAKIGGSNATPGTYKFDEAAAYGLKLEVAPGYNGNATITWR